MGNVDHPSHYNTGSVEVIDAIEDWKLGFHEGNVVKYVARAQHKGKQLEDLKKAAWYLNRLIAQLEPDPAKQNRDVLLDYIDGDDGNLERPKCYQCEGSGHGGPPDNRCNNCHGLGYIPPDKSNHGPG